MKYCKSIRSHLVKITIVFIKTDNLSRSNFVFAECEMIWYAVCYTMYKWINTDDQNTIKYLSDAECIRKSFPLFCHHLDHPSHQIPALFCLDRHILGRFYLSCPQILNLSLLSTLQNVQPFLEVVLAHPWKKQTLDLKYTLLNTSNLFSFCQYSTQLSSPSPVIPCYEGQCLSSSP